MRVNDIIEEAQSVAADLKLTINITDITDNACNLRINFRSELFIQIYANELKNKINFALIFRGKRLFGFDNEGGGYHIHPVEAPDSHILTVKEKPLKEFAMESLMWLEKKEIL